MRILAAAAAAAGLILATAAGAQTDPSNPGGQPLAPTKGPINQSSQGQVLRDAAPGADADVANQPRAPSVLNGVEEPQRTQTTRPVKGEPPSNDRTSAPIETGASPQPR